MCDINEKDARELHIGETIFDSYILAIFFEMVTGRSFATNNRNGQKIKLQDQIASVSKLLESIVLHEKLYSRFLIAFEYVLNEYSAYQHIKDSFCIDDNPDELLRVQLMYEFHSAGGAYNYANYESKYFELGGFSYTTINRPDNTLSNYQKYQNQALILTAKEAKSQIVKNNEWINDNYFSLETPLIFNYVVQKSTSLEDMMKRTIDLRNSKEAKMFRKMSAAFEYCLKTQSNDDVVFIIGEMGEAISKLSKKNSTPPSTPIDISFPSLSFDVDIDDIVSKLPFWKKNHLEFISRLYDSALRSSGTGDKFVSFLDK